MHFSLLSIGPGMNVTNSTFMVMIAVLACILGAEIAGIGILISKLLRARRAKYDTRYEVDEEESSSHRHYSVGLLLLLGAVPQSTYIALSVLITLTAIMAVVFVLLLIIFRICGYDLVSSKRSRPVEEPETEAEAPMPEVPTEDATAYEEARYPEETEEQRQEAYTVLSDASYTEEDPFAVLNEESVAEVEDETDDTVEEAATVEEEPVVAECADMQVGESVAPVATSTTVTTSTEEPSFADGTRPYKVVEKVVTETVKEIYKETPAPEQHSTTNDAVMEKLVDLLDYEIRSRRELELAEAAKNEKTDTDASKKSDGSVATFAMTGRDADEELDDEDDEDEVDELEESDETKSENDDVDDEENDTEGDHFTGNERIIGFDEATGCYIVAHYRKSFEAKLIQARPNIKKYYSDIKNALLSYKGTKNRISWNADSFHNGREQIAKINVKTRILEIYLALDPASLDGTVYRGKDVGSKKKYADTPFQYKVRTPRKFKWAMELVQRVCEEHGLSPIDIEPVNYEEQYPFDTTENLVERKLIKEYIRQEKPATSFELDPDHVPEVPEEDESVIPANANFSWEFDNEMLVEQEPISEPEPEIEPEPAPEPEPEPELVEEPTPAPEAAPAATVTRETVKVTEMRYTERYYTDAAPTYEQVITTTEPIEPIEAPVESAEAAETVIEDATETFDDILSENEVADEEVVEVDPFEDDAEASEDSDFEEVDGVVAEDVTEESYAESDESYDEIDEEADDASEEELFFEDEATDADGEDFAEEESFEEEAFEEEELPADEGDFEESFEEEAYEEEAYEEETNEEEAYEEEKESEEVIAVPEKSRNDTAGTLPFRPSFYANRNYYAEETPTVDETDDVSDEEDESIAVNSTWDEDDGEAYNDGEEYEEDEYAEEEYAEDDYADEEYPDEDSEAEAVLGEDDDADEYEEDEEEDAPAPQPAVARNVNPSVALVDLCSLEAYFDEGDVINLDSLKVRELVLPSASILKLYASGPISKRFIVEANHFTLDAIKAISDADGDSVMVR